MTPISLDGLKLTALDCRDCGLCERRTHVVFGEGDPKAPLVLVGEGPGEEEDMTGRPFVGRAGKLLDQALLDNGLTREQVYICNTVKCRAADWSTGRPVNRAPTETEALACRRWLLPQLASIGPEVVLCVGAPSARNLIKKDFKITVERGRYFPSVYARTIMATLHPSYVLRQMNMSGDASYSLLVADIGKAWDAAVRLRSRSTGLWPVSPPGVSPGVGTSDTGRKRGLETSLFDTGQDALGIHGLEARTTGSGETPGGTHGQDARATGIGQDALGTHGLEARATGDL